MKDIFWIRGKLHEDGRRFGWKGRGGEIPHTIRHISTLTDAQTDVLEGASGASADAPRFDLRRNLFSNVRKILAKTKKDLMVLLVFSYIFSNYCH